MLVVSSLLIFTVVQPPHRKATASRTMRIIDVPRHEASGCCRAGDPVRAGSGATHGDKVYARTQQSNAASTESAAAVSVPSRLANAAGATSTPELAGLLAQDLDGAREVGTDALQFG